MPITTDFERDVIDRLARIEENAKQGATLAATVVLQGCRLDALERKVDTSKSYMLGAMAASTALGGPIVAYLWNRLVGAIH